MVINAGLHADSEALVKDATTISTRFMSVLKSPTSARRGSRRASEEGEQYRALLELLLTTGLRIGEALGLNASTVSTRLQAARRDFERAAQRYHRRDVWKVG